MRTIGWIFILIGLIVMRQSIRQRPLNEIPKDIGDLITGVATAFANPADGVSKMRDVLNRTNDSAINVGIVPVVSSTPMASVTSANGLLGNMHQLAAEAGNRYVWGGTTSNGYDCSGLVWAGMRKSGIYNGLRFTTITFLMNMTGRVQRVTDPQVGDIILWSAHMGVIDGSGTMYSALNPKDGIRSSPISYGPKDSQGNLMAYGLYRLLVKPTGM